MAKEPAWKIIMSVVKPGLGRPRFFSLHTLAELMGRKDLRRLATTLENSEKVIGCHCPVVDAPVFYLKAYAHFTYDIYIWDEVDDFIKKFPYPKIKGFKASASYWTEGYGKGKFIKAKYDMSVPFVPEDYSYANTIIDALVAAGYKPGIPKYDVKPVVAKAVQVPTVAETIARAKPALELFRGRKY